MNEIETVRNGIGNFATPMSLKVAVQEKINVRYPLRSA
jgi:hypothetical protein